MLTRRVIATAFEVVSASALIWQSRGPVKLIPAPHVAPLPTSRTAHGDHRSHHRCRSNLPRVDGVVSVTACATEPPVGPWGHWCGATAAAVTCVAARAGIIGRVMRSMLRGRRSGRGWNSQRGWIDQVPDGGGSLKHGGYIQANCRPIGAAGVGWKRQHFWNYGDRVGTGVARSAKTGRTGAWAKRNATDSAPGRRCCSSSLRGSDVSCGSKNSSGRSAAANAGNVSAVR
jgi:hypothetical protein